tara:strand:+ start:651 stop:851 length:201 start_codon:yes stop_codon:yes gene_type:complete
MYSSTARGISSRPTDSEYVVLRVSFSKPLSVQIFMPLLRRERESVHTYAKKQEIKYFLHGDKEAAI